MSKNITGLHHVTALASDPQVNIDFYAGILGVRMVKKTVNFDAPDVYHIYYGNETGNPGTILTFFPYSGMFRGRKGNGQLTVISFSVAENALEYWMERFNRFGVSYERPRERFNGETYIYFEDNDGLGLELVANSLDKREPFTYGHIPAEVSIKGFYGVLLSEDRLDQTANLLIGQMDHTLIAESDNRYRFSAGVRDAEFVDVEVSLRINGRGGAGTVHHVAFSTDNDESQAVFRETLVNGGLTEPTTVLDRQYFHSIYFREPGGVLFEAATSDIGFAIDEPVEHLGESLRLPRWEEKNRNRIERLLTPVSFDPEKFRTNAQVRYP
jgi:glyoxalase family protein